MLHVSTKDMSPVCHVCRAVTLASFTILRQVSLHLAFRYIKMARVFARFLRLWRLESLPFPATFLQCCHQSTARGKARPCHLLFRSALTNRSACECLDRFDPDDSFSKDNDPDDSFSKDLVLNFLVTDLLLGMFLLMSE